MSLLKIRDLHVEYQLRNHWFSRNQVLHAVNGVSFELNPGETLGLVGESGCGKSTLGKAIVGLEKAASGEIQVDGCNWHNLSSGALRRERRKAQMIFQDPYGSLNPRLSIGATLDEVLALLRGRTPQERRQRAGELLELVGLNKAMLNRYPHQFSGGQRQRIGIARALALEPKLIVADEPVSALDVSVQAQIINLLQELQKSTGTAFLFISHDLGVVEHLSHRIMVMYLGKIVEVGPAKELCATPAHPYTQALLSAVPTLKNSILKERIILKGDVPSPVNPPSGCPFHPRCPLAQERCRCEAPVLRNTTENPERQVACFMVAE